MLRINVSRFRMVRDISDSGRKLLRAPDIGVFFDYVILLNIGVIECKLKQDTYIILKMNFLKSER